MSETQATGKKPMMTRKAKVFLLVVAVIAIGGVVRIVIKENDIEHKTCSALTKALGNDAALASIYDDALNKGASADKIHEACPYEWGLAVKASLAAMG